MEPLMGAARAAVKTEKARTTLKSMFGSSVAGSVKEWSVMEEVRYARRTRQE